MFDACLSLPHPSLIYQQILAAVLSIHIQKLTISHPPPVHVITIFHPHFRDSFRTGLPAFPLALVYSQPRSQNKPFRHKSDRPTPLLQTLDTMEYYSAVKKENLPFGTTWIDPEGIVLSETSQTKKSKYCMISLVCRL